MQNPSVRESEKIKGLYHIDLVVMGDERGEFKEAYQKEKLESVGLPGGFEIIQQNIATNPRRGVTRGIHAEPWDKFITIATGRIFVAIVDFRKGEGFGNFEEFELTPDKAIFLPKGVGNSYQTLEENVVYSYLVNEHWYPDAKYAMCNLDDDELAINWPIPLEQAIISEKDNDHPPMSEVQPMELES